MVWFTLLYPAGLRTWCGRRLRWLPATARWILLVGTVVHINAAIAGLVGAYLIAQTPALGKEAFKPHNLPMVFTGTAILV